MMASATQPAFEPVFAPIFGEIRPLFDPFPPILPPILTPAFEALVRPEKRPKCAFFRLAGLRIIVKSRAFSVFWELRLPDWMGEPPLGQPIAPHFEAMWSARATSRDSEIGSGYSARHSRSILGHTYYVVHKKKKKKKIRKKKKNG
jgi:hypothetical protein